MYQLLGEGLGASSIRRACQTGRPGMTSCILDGISVSPRQYLLMLCPPLRPIRSAHLRLALFTAIVSSVQYFSGVVVGLSQRGSWRGRTLSLLTMATLLFQGGQHQVAFAWPKP